MILYNYIIHPIENFYRIIYLLFADWFGNYGIAVIALSLLNFILLYPFTRRANQIQQEELHLQKILQEQLGAIKEKYSGAEQFEKMQRLYDRFSYHPVMAIRSVFGLLIQLPFLLAAFYMLSNCKEIQGVSWGIIPNLGKPDALLNGINIFPFLMTVISVIYAFIVPNFDRRQKVQTIIVSIIFLLLLYSAPSALLIFWSCNILWSLLNSIFSEKVKWLGEYVAENELAFQIIFALSLTVGLLVPLEVYIKNASQLWFSLKDIFKYLLADTTKCFIILLAVFIFCWRKKNKGIYLSILLGLLFGVFLQSYIIGVNYGLFDGHEIVWEQYTKAGLLNTFIWCFCLGETFVVFKRLKFDLEKLKKYVKPITFGIVAIQCFVLIFILKNNPLPEDVSRSKDSINVLTTKDMFTISAKDNIIVFLLDAFDAKIFEEMMVKNPEIIKELSGFTFYPDTTSVFGYSDYSVPQILTGKVYQNDTPYSEYIEKAWHNNSSYDNLIQNNYDIGIYTNGMYVSSKAPILNSTREKIVLNDESMQDLSKLVLFRISPHYLKKLFYNYDPNSWTRLLANKDIHVYKEDDRNFYLRLKEGLMLHNRKNCFRFYHLNGAHFPFILDQNLEFINSNMKGSQYNQAIAVMKIVLEYIKQMKKASIFDNSVFVIMADHGDHNVIGSRPLLCLKKRNDKNSDMVISNRPMSFLDFSSLLYKKSYYDVRNNENRKYFFVTSRNDFEEYHIVGNAKFKESWIKVNIIKNWKYNNKKSTYKLGDVIDFTINGDSELYKQNGWSKEEIYGTWFLGKSADLLFEIEDYRQQNLKLTFLTSVYIENQARRTIKVFANNKLISEFSKDSGSGFIHSIKIPSSLVNGNRLNICFSISYAEETQNLGLYMHNLVIEADE